MSKLKLLAIILLSAYGGYFYIGDSIFADYTLRGQDIKLHRGVVISEGLASFSYCDAAVIANRIWLDKGLMRFHAKGNVGIYKRRSSECNILPKVFERLPNGALLSDSLYMHESGLEFRGLNVNLCGECRKSPIWSLYVSRATCKGGVIELDNLDIMLRDKVVWKFNKINIPNDLYSARNGFLIPYIQYNSSIGMSLSLPYYVRPANNIDITFSPKFASSGLFYDFAYRHMVNEHFIYMINATTGKSVYGKHIGQINIKSRLNDDMLGNMHLDANIFDNDLLRAADMKHRSLVWRKLITARGGYLSLSVLNRGRWRNDDIAMKFGDILPIFRRGSWNATGEIDGHIGKRSAVSFVSTFLNNGSVFNVELKPGLTISFDKSQSVSLLETTVIPFVKGEVNFNSALVRSDINIGNGFGFHIINSSGTSNDVSGVEDIERKVDMDRYFDTARYVVYNRSSLYSRASFQYNSGVHNIQASLYSQYWISKKYMGVDADYYRDRVAPHRVSTVYSGDGLSIYGDGWFRHNNMEYVRGDISALFHSRDSGIGIAYGDKSNRYYEGGEGRARFVSGFIRKNSGAKSGTIFMQKRKGAEGLEGGVILDYEVDCISIRGSIARYYDKSNNKKLKIGISLGIPILKRK